MATSDRTPRDTSNNDSVKNMRDESTDVEQSGNAAADAAEAKRPAGYTGTQPQNDSSPPSQQ